MIKFAKACIAVGALTMLFGQAGTIEGNMFPAAAPFTIESVKKVDSEVSAYDVVMSSKKLPQPISSDVALCEFVQLTFRSRDGTSIPYISITPQHGTRNEGEFVIGQRMFVASELDIYKMSVSALHDCPYRPWLKRTNMTPEVFKNLEEKAEQIE